MRPPFSAIEPLSDGVSMARRGETLTASSRDMAGRRCGGAGQRAVGRSGGAGRRRRGRILGGAAAAAASAPAARAAAPAPPSSSGRRRTTASRAAPPSTGRRRAAGFSVDRGLATSSLPQRRSRWPHGAAGHHAMGERPRSFRRQSQYSETSRSQSRKSCFLLSPALLPRGLMHARKRQVEVCLEIGEGRAQWRPPGRSGRSRSPVVPARGQDRPSGPAGAGGCGCGRPRRRASWIR